VVSNNKDFEKVLATVVQTITIFLETYPARKVFFEGSTKVRTRLYQIVINRELDSFGAKFMVKGLSEQGFEEYQKDKTYDGFLVELLNK
jgi:hypothetical protein